MPFGIFSLCQVGGTKGKTTQTGAALAVLPARSIHAAHGCASLLRASCPQSFHLPCPFQGCWEGWYFSSYPWPLKLWLVPDQV